MKNKVIILVIITLAFVLRFWNLGNYPALNADEAALGYNAYSLLKTGKDEHGNVWPIHFQSFNDYKPGGYVYLVMPFVYLFGLNEWIVRIPGALAGVGTIIVLFFLMKELFPDRNSFSVSSFQFSFPEISALFLAISPWHIHFSRGAWEVNVATFFITMGLFFLLKSINSVGEIKSKLFTTYLFCSFLSFIFSLYTYHSARIIVPLLGIGILMIYWKVLLKIWSKLIIPALLGTILLIPLFIDLLGPAGVSRVSGVGIFADPGPLSRADEQRGEHENYESIFTKLHHNKYVNYTLSFFQNYTEHFHGEFLFLSGDDIQRNKVPETGQMYGFEFVLILIGLWQISQKKSQFGSHSSKLILWWLIIAPVAAAFTFQSPHALRAQNMIIPATIISSIGFVSLLIWIDKNKTKFFNVAYYLIITTVLFWSVGRYLHMYYKHMSVEYPYSSQYGVKELVNYLNENFTDKKVVITTRYDQPYILFLFYGVSLNSHKYSPSNFQSDHELTDKDIYGFSTVSSYDRFKFESLDFQKTKEQNTGSLIVGTPEEIPQESNIIKRIYGTNNFEYFNIVAN